MASSEDCLIQDNLFDLQISGGLLICVEKESADDLVKSLKKSGINDEAVIGEVLPEPAGKIVVS